MSWSVADSGKLFRYELLYLFLGPIQRLPSTREMRTNAMAIHEKMVLSVAMPIVKNAIPRIRKTTAAWRLFDFMDAHRSLIAKLNFWIRTWIFK